MVRIVLQKDQGSDGNRAVIPDGTPFEATVIEVVERESIWDIDKDDPDKGKKVQLNFKFSIIDPQGTFDERWVWGNTSDYFTTSPTNKLRQWAQAILDVDVLPEGYALETNDFAGRQVRVIVGAKEKRDGSGLTNLVTELRPTKSTAPLNQSPVGTPGPADMDEDPF